MFKNKPVTLLIAAGLIVLLIVSAGVYPLISRSLRLGGPGGMSRGNPMGFQSNGNLPANVTPPQGFQPGQRQGGNDEFTQGGMGSNFSGTFPSSTSTSMKLIQLLRWVQMAGAIIVILFGVLSLLGVFLSKDWGRKMAIAASIFALLFAITGMFGFMIGLSLWINIAVIGLSIIIMVLSALGKSRIVATVPA
jgi:hypothetical protein